MITFETLLTFNTGVACLQGPVCGLCNGHPDNVQAAAGYSWEASGKSPSIGHNLASAVTECVAAKI